MPRRSSCLGYDGFCLFATKSSYGVHLANSHCHAVRVEQGRSNHVKDFWSSVTKSEECDTRDTFAHLTYVCHGHKIWAQEVHNGKNPDAQNEYPDQDDREGEPFTIRHCTIW